MRDYIVGGSLNLIKKDNPDYSDEKLEILEYGLTGLYIFISKSIIIFTIAYFLGILKELIIFMLIYNSIRLVSFGMHATSSTACLIGSTVSFLSATYFCKTYLLPMGFKIIFGIISIVYVYLHSPADTEKRPIISPKRRFIYKFLSTLIALVMVVCSIVLDNAFISNSFSIALLIQCFMISPFAYKITGQKYDNYKDYLNN